MSQYRESEPFGLERLMLEFESVGDRPTEDIRTHIIDVVRRWAPELTDDRSLVALRYAGTREPSVA